MCLFVKIENKWQMRIDNEDIGNNSASCRISRTWIVMHKKLKENERNISFCDEPKWAKVRSKCEHQFYLGKEMPELDKNEHSVIVALVVLVFRTIRFKLVLRKLIENCSME